MYMATLDKLLALPFSEVDYLKAYKHYPMSKSEYREAERLAGIILFLADDLHVIEFRMPDSSGAYYTLKHLPNSLTFQWMSEIRYEEERAKDTDRHENLAPIGGYGRYTRFRTSKSLTDPSNKRVWMRAIGEWMDNTRLVRGSGQSVCDFCAGPCGDCPQRWSDDPHSCDRCMYDDGEDSECIDCPCRPDLLRHVERDAVHESPYEAMLFSSYSRYPGCVPPLPSGYYPGYVPPPAPDPSLAGYGSQSQPAQN